MNRVGDAHDGFPEGFEDVLKALPRRFTLGQLLEAGERRGLPARQSFNHLQALKRAGAVDDDGFWFTKR